MMSLLRIGKVLAKRNIPELDDAAEEPLLKHDSSTNPLIRRYRNRKRAAARDEQRGLRWDNRPANRRYATPRPFSPWSLLIQ